MSLSDLIGFYSNCSCILENESLEVPVVPPWLVALNATTAHNNNLARLYGGLHSGACKLCGGNQTLLHVLNRCDVALQLRRYNRRHDQVLHLLLE